jgi:malate permease and related proteins
MNQTVAILNKVLPVILLIGIGFFLARKKFFSEQTIAQMRKMVLNLALPAALFLSFLQMELEASYILLVVFMFVLCFVLFAIGILVKKIFNIDDIYFAYLLTGFEYGMLGMGLFGTAFGIDHIGPIAVTALGHEIFIWFLFLPLLLVKRDGRQDIKKVAKSFFTSPVIIAIITSLILNALDAGKVLHTLPFTGAILEAAKFLSYLTVPLVLIIIGYGIKLEKKSLGKAFAIVGYRLCLLIPAALILGKVFIRGLLGLPAVFEIAFFSFLILPPPFIIPLFIKKDLPDQERSLINNTLTMHALFSIVVYIIYFVLISSPL